MGGSYLGYTQLTQGMRASSHLLAMSADFTSSDIHDGWVYVDGAFLLGFALPWGAATIDGHINQARRVRLAFGIPAPAAATADAAAGHVNRPYRDWLQHPRRDDPYWNGISFEREARSIAVPLLVVQGWYDIFLRGALRDDIAIRQGSAPSPRRCASA